MDKFYTVEERKKLYEEIWKEPVSAVAQRYNLSDNALRRRCIKLDIPLPPRGYWEKIKSGQKIEKPALSKVFGNSVYNVHNSVIKYKYNSNEIPDNELSTEEELSLLTDETKALISRRCDEIVVKGKLRNPHKLILNHQEEMKFRKQKEKELRENMLFFNMYPSKGTIYTNYKSSLPINVSKENLNKVYRILDALFKSVEDLDGSVTVEPYVGKDVANIRINRHFFGFEIREDYKRCRNNKKNNKDDMQESESIVLQFFPRSSLNQKLNDNLEYWDSEISPIEKQLKKILYNLFVISNKLDILDEISNREFEKRMKEEKRKRILEEQKENEL